ncbi:YVTN family beta-propeller protein [Saccharothrix tamanrassetensis]|uniref:YVTN family beta-propeller protein n=1 Tax=Saccharothrix tamanrassetensis TaxID=1051531 RepID=A0A841CWM1_9PSEU|nr:YncE family protein [Saccharothrix tamanrassetensis]MBB5960518.1 YVTN family beta-propeller protein [Saccharothrix tamanrassetensis]
MSPRRAALAAAALLVCSAVAALTPTSTVLTAADTVAPRAYVIARSGQVQVLDTSDGTILAHDDTGALTTGAAVAPDGRRVYVVNGRSGVVTAVDPGAGVVGRIQTGVQLAQAVLRPDGERLYVTGSGVVAVIQPNPFRLIAAIKVGNQPQGIAVTPDGAELYVANTGDGTVSVLDTKSATVITTVTVGGLPQQVAISPDGGEVYVSSLNLPDEAGTVHAIDTRSRRVGWSAPVGKGAGSIAVTPDGRCVYVALDRGVARLDTTTRTGRKLKLAVKSLAIAPGDRRVFLAAGKKAVVLDSTDDSVVDTFHLSGLNDDGRGFEATAIAFDRPVG